MTKTPPKSDAGPIRMSLSSRFENIELAQHLCGKLLEGREVPEETRHWLLMALREALANAIKHGNRQDAAKRIHLEMDVVDERSEERRVGKEGGARARQYAAKGRGEREEGTERR